MDSKAHISNQADIFIRALKSIATYKGNSFCDDAPPREEGDGA
ncbi:MAG TPA: hypothetical protein V6D25_17575 [Leptolyngbyaceae cyanobacterium]